MGGEVVTARVADGTVTIVDGPAQDPNTTVTFAPAAFYGFVAGMLDLSAAEDAGDLEIQGDAAAARILLWALGVPRRPAEGAPADQHTGKAPRRRPEKARSGGSEG